MNRSLKSGIFFALLTVVSIACDPIRGQLHVNRSFQVKINTTQPNCSVEMDPTCGYGSSESATLSPGQYQMNVEMITRRDAQILVRAGKKDLKIELAIPDGKEIPATGAVVIYGSESGQPFDLHAQTQTHVTRTETTRTIESCEIVWTERICGIKPGQSGKGKDVKDEKPVYQCWNETFRKPGTQDVEFFYETTTQNMQATIHERGSQAASFSGSRSNTEKIYTFKGTCFERRW